MDKFILINLNMFTMNHQIFIVDEERGMATLGAFSVNQLPAVLDQATDGADTKKIRIAGNRSYAQDLIDLLKTYEFTKYSQNTLDIEVI